MRLERSRTDSKMFGLCGGLARSMNADPSWIRLGLVIGTILTGGLLFIVYIIVSMVVPKEASSPAYGPYQYVPAASAYSFKDWKGEALGHFQSIRLQEEPALEEEEQALLRELKELRARAARYEQQQ